MSKTVYKLSLLSLAATLVIIGACKATTNSVAIYEPELSGIIIFAQTSKSAFLEPNGTPVNSSTKGVILTSNIFKPSSAGLTGANPLNIAHDIETKLRGNKIKVTAVIKTLKGNPSEEFAVAYSTNMNGNSGWLKFTPTTSLKPYSMEYTVPPTDRPANLEYWYSGRY